MSHNCDYIKQNNYLFYQIQQHRLRLVVNSGSRFYRRWLLVILIAIGSKHVIDSKNFLSFCCTFLELEYVSSGIVFANFWKYFSWQIMVTVYITNGEKTYFLSISTLKLLTPLPSPTRHPGCLQFQHLFFN